jgi:hypothetical protein
LIDGTSISVIHIGNASIDSLDAGKINTGYLSADRIDAGTIVASKLGADVISAGKIVAGLLTASNIQTGTLTVGGSSGANAIQIKHTGTKASAIVKWEGGSGIWEDTSNYLGLWSYGGEMYLWTGGNADPAMYLGLSNINIYQTLHPKQINMALVGSGWSQTEGDIINVDKIKGYNDIRFEGNGDVLFFKDNSENVGVRVAWGTGKISSNASSITLGGHTLTLTGDVSLP